MSNKREKLKDIWIGLSESIVGTVFKWVLSLALLFAFLGGVVFDWFEEGEGETVEEETNYDEKYEVVSDVSTDFGRRSGVEMTILLKDPFITSEQFDELITYIKEEKDKVAGDNDKKLAALSVEAYMRESNINDLASPVGTGTYMHKDGWLPSLESSHWFYRGYEYETEFDELRREEKDNYLTDKEYNTLKKLLMLKELASMDWEGSVDVYREYVEFHGKGISEDEMVKLLNRAFSYEGRVGIYRGKSNIINERLEEVYPEIYEFMREYWK